MYTHTHIYVHLLECINTHTHTHCLGITLVHTEHTRSSGTSSINEYSNPPYDSVCVDSVLSWHTLDDLIVFLWDGWWLPWATVVLERCVLTVDSEDWPTDLEQDEEVNGLLWPWAGPLWRLSLSLQHVGWDAESAFISVSCWVAVVFGEREVMMETVEWVTGL